MDEVSDRLGSPPGPGTDLRGAREARGLSVRDVARSLRLDIGIIEALERDDYAALPAPIFIKGYLNSYSRLLGLSVQDVVANYERAVGGVKPPPLVVTRAAVEASGGIAGSKLVGWLVVFAVLAMAVLWWVAKPQSGPSPEPVAQASQPVLLPEPPPIVEEITLVEAVEPPQVEPEVLAGSPEVVPGNVRLRMAFREECWTEVVDALGNRLFFDLAVAGRTVEVEGPGPLVIFLGNAPGVDIRVDGRRYDHSRYNRAGNVARFRIPETNP